MSVDFEDYYETLDVDRGASQEDIQKAFRKKAKAYHPDVSDDPDAEEKFKKVNEAYEVLKDPQTRAKYDQLGKNWKAGKGFEPPPGWSGGWDNVRVNVGGAGGFEDLFGGGGGPTGGFSDFFNAFFGGGGAAPRGRGRARERYGRRGRSREAEVTISLHDVIHGAERQISMPVTEQTADGRWVERSKTYKVKIPAGTTDGTVIRLAGQGEPGVGPGAAGDLLLRVHIAPDPSFEVEGHDLYAELKLAPWEAALGTKAKVSTPDGDVTLTIPAGSQGGNKLRLRGRGLPKKGGSGRGDLYVTVRIRVPREMSDRERMLFEALREESTFNPRGE